MKQTVSKLANHDLVCIYWAEKLEDAYRMLNDKKIRHLPVVDHRGEIVGIISDRDFQRAMSIDQPDFISGKTPKAEFDPNSRIRDFMSWPVEAIDEDADVAVAAKKMIDRKISSLLVTKRGRVTGIVTTDDLLRVLFETSPVAPESIAERVRGGIYNSTIGSIAMALANSGI